MPDHFDKVLRENINAMVVPMCRKYFGFEIITATNLPSRLQVTTGREADFVKLVTTASGEEFILHIEYQVTDDPNMLYRMQTYHALLMQKYKKEVRQFVIYLGNSDPKMRSKLNEAEIMRGFELKNVKAFDQTELLRSDIPEEIILAILADYEDRDPVAVVRLICQRLMQVRKEEGPLLSAVQQLGMLSRLRKLQKVVIEEAKNMPITYNKKKDILYVEGKGEGREEGMEIGALRKSIEVATQMLETKRFSHAEITKISGLSQDRIEALKKELGL